ncbi:MAG: DEAD/DEAH box helicase [Acidimicrobiia bacterium]|nr:DEAD/DEAH box helicase [Acidimicrobiia bacterium]
MTLDELLAGWASSPDLEGDLVHVEALPERRAIHGDSDPPLSIGLSDILAGHGIERLYRHQARAISHIRAGRHTVVVAGTAGGKTLCYTVPIAETILENPRSAALALYPTKALAQDQLRSIGGLGVPGLVASTYDGDTPPEDRTWARRHANVILTNPDMLHIGILPNHAKWADFLLRLEYVVIDEMHMLRGVFGTHVGMILRRLRRLAAHYGANPTFVFTSATIGNPGDLAERLIGMPVTVAEGDDSPSGRKLVALWNPPLEDADLGKRRSAMAETTDLFIDLVRNDFHTIAFSRSRKATELIYRWARDRLDDERKDKIAPYRSGYLASERRETEAALFSGELLGVTATNALELGIDVGALDAAIINTFPGTISSFRQQAGRAGRTQAESLAVLVGGEDALDQYFMHHPSELFSRTPEAVVINPNNPMIVEAHTACAAHELPLELADREFLGDAMEEAVAGLSSQGHLEMRRGRLFWAHRQAPAPRVGIRSSGGPTYTVVADGEVIGTMEEQRAFRDGHQGAIYLHQGETYVVDQLDLDRHEIAASARQVDYFTQTKQEKTLDVLGVSEQTAIGRLRYHLGQVRVESYVTGYQTRKIGSGEVIDHVWLDLPPTVFETESVWYTVPESVLGSAGIGDDRLLGTLHAAEHAGIAMLPLFAVCDRWDIGGLSTNWHPDAGLPTVFIYEGYPGGAGISPIAYDMALSHLEATLEAIRSCACDHGCPSCVQSPKCGNFNEPLDKDGAIRFIEAALGP